MKQNGENEYTQKVCFCRDKRPFLPLNRRVTQEGQKIQENVEDYMRKLTQFISQNRNKPVMEFQSHPLKKENAFLLEKTDVEHCESKNYQEQQPLQG